MKLKTGQLVVTRSVNEEIARNESFAKFVMEALVKHRNCNWGQTHPDDIELNDKSVTNDWRVVAKHQNKDFTIFIITEWDRSVTTILFPDEY